MSKVRCDEKSLVKTLRELVQIPSLSGKEREAASYVAGRLKQLDLKPIVDRYYNVTVVIGSGRTLLLNAHLDTVPPSGSWTFNPYSAEMVDKKIYGVGASDNKSGVAVMLEVARLFVEHPLPGSILLLFTSREESNKGRTREYICKHLRAEAGISLDSHINVNKKVAPILIGCKAIGNFLINVHGKAYHSSEPNRGVNAIYRSVEFINALRKAKFPSMTSPLREKALASVTKIKTDGWATMIPDLCQLIVNYRGLPTEQLEEAEVRLRRLAEVSLSRRFELQSTVFEQGYLLNPQQKIVQVAKQSALELGLKPQLAIAKGWIDAAAFYRLARIPLVGLGPVTPGQQHVKNEFEHMDNLICGAELTLKTITNYLAA